MKLFKPLLSILLAAVWISVSEFVRNQFLLQSYWTRHYRQLGLSFPSSPLNGAMWGLWSLMFAIAIFILARKFTLLQTTVFSWYVAFVMMWVVIGNLGVLPHGLLWSAVPLSLLEAFVAAAIIRAVDGRPHSRS